MKTEIRIIYSCDHCKKMYKREHAAIRHEKYCNKNPANFHACFGCEHLKVDRENLDGGIFDRISVKTFKCAKLDKELHSFKAEKINHSCLGSTERMPLECEHYEDAMTRFFKEVDKDETPEMQSQGPFSEPYPI